MTQLPQPTVNITREQIRQAAFDGIMHYYGMDDADNDDQVEAAEIVDSIMARIDDTLHAAIKAPEPNDD